MRKITNNFMAAPCFQLRAIDAVPYAAESHLVKLFEDANLLARHGKRITVYDSEIKLIQRILGEMKLEK